MSPPRGAGALGASVALLGAFAALPALAADDPREWLAAMNRAVATRTYQGEYVHIGGGRTDMFKILHRYRDGHVAEHLISLSGNGREVVRTDGEVQCFLPDERKVVVESHAEHGSLIGPFLAADANLDSSYRLELGPRVHSAVGRPARELRVIPLDDLRFGYRLQLDEETRMPLLTELCDAEGHVLERVLFTSIKFDGPLTDAMFRPTVSAEGFTWVRQLAAHPARNGAVIAWHLGQLPPGFRVSSSDIEVLPGGDGPVMHFVVSDGLASVSVFIAAPSPPHRAVNGQGRVGTASAFSREVGDQEVTAVGEVPPQTLQVIASGVAPAAASKASASGPPASPQR